MNYYDCNRCDRKCEGDYVMYKGKLRYTGCPGWIPPKGGFKLEEALLDHPQSFINLHYAGFKVELP